MESHSPPLTAQVTGSCGSSAPDHRPLPSSSSSSSPSSPSSSSSSSASTSSSPSPAPRSRPRSSSVIRAGTRPASATSSERPPLPTPDLEGHKSREQPPAPKTTSRPDSTLSRVHRYPERFATIRRGDIIIDDSGIPRPGPRRGHRRRSTHVTPADLASFRREVLGIETSPSIVPEEETKSQQTQDPSSDPQLSELNEAFASASMSMSSGSGMTGSSPGSGMFSGYVDNNVPRQSMASPVPHASGQVNGGAMPGMNAGVPMNAGHQMDLQHLYDMVLELSDVLKNNRDMTKSIVSSAEDLMKDKTRAGSEGASPSVQQAGTEITAARIAELEHALAKEKQVVEILKSEQFENTKLIGEYEAATGTMVEQIRNYCQNNNMHFLAQKRHYNNLLQAERDAHLDSRLDRDYWHAQTMKCSNMIHTALRLRTEEDVVPIRVVAGLQNEVRAYRQALGMEPETPEEEYGWEILKDVPPSPE